ncbi:MAG: oligosaccharide flippase family protein, partial [Clostridiales bacterium]|nr:oligosaccharide flippase family protein [Clostridiales bacterium]
MQKSSFSTTKNVFIAGTLFLTLAGVATRIIGFFYRIFLSRLIGAEGLGIYQLLSPVTALGFAVTAAGIQTSISKFVSTEIGKKNPAAARHYLAVGLLISLFLSTITGLFIWLFADFMADSLLGDTRCTPLLRVLSFSFVPACIHACINGYYYGLKKTAVPSLCQLSEQLARVGSVYVMYHICIEKGQPFSLSMTIWGLVIGEIA